MNPTNKCCICRKLVVAPAHEATVQKRFQGWAPGRSFPAKVVYCEPCLKDLERANEEYAQQLRER